MDINHKNTSLEMGRVNPDVLELLNMSTDNREITTIIGVIDSDSYKHIVKDSNIIWNYKFINIALNLKDKTIFKFSTATSDKQYNLPNVFNNKLVIRIYISNSNIMYNSLYFISNFIKKSLIDGLTSKNI